ncbi:sulfate ABC transporter permease subunit CysW [Brevundimonas faecalis]|uniref:sulfate ABC transporter permease subunit CysW n=1 Tax=Brevundimonas faecalis TaxID=947378 RepID=UPI00361DA5F1
MTSDTLTVTPVRTAAPPVRQRLLIGLALTWLALIVLAPLAVILVEALRRGAEGVFGAFSEPDVWAAARLTLLTTAIATPLNAVFGLAAAWCVTRFQFRGKTLLMALIDLPLSVSPVISGLVWVLLFGASGWFAPWLNAWGLQIMFTPVAIVLATVLVTLSYVARELIPLMQQQGSDEELAALTLGARPFAVFFMITLPNVRWALLYGVLLANARAMGEFGAVSVVSGHIRGLTNTLPLHVEILYNEYDFVGAFATAALLATLALVTLLLKSLLEHRHADDLAARGAALT